MKHKSELAWLFQFNSQTVAAIISSQTQLSIQLRTKGYKFLMVNHLLWVKTALFLLFSMGYRTCDSWDNCTICYPFSVERLEVFLCSLLLWKLNTFFFFFFSNVKDAPHLVSLCLNKFTGTCSSDQPEISVPKETFFFFSLLE